MPYADPETRRQKKAMRKLALAERPDILVNALEYLDKKGVTKPLQEKQIELIIKCLKIGMGMTEACILAGCSRHRVARHAAKDPVLGTRLLKAVYRCKKHHLTRVYEAEKNWQASAWFLERAFRKEFSLVAAEATSEERAIQVRKVVRSSGPLALSKAPSPDMPGPERMRALSNAN